MVQMGPNELDPNQWTGNQRVVHFGLLAQRDAFFYYYPKGWDVLYPAHFGFFPYRTTYVIAAGLLMGCVDEMVQTGPNELDPNQWTGNQRVVHFGPLAQRDAFFYYYPKGWDVLYPAHFGFFPYRTTYVIAAGLLMGCVDEMVQMGPNELDPNQWTGNQRVVHFGLLAQRDAFFYYYPKGWDVLYPAHFGFFPYRTTYVIAAGLLMGCVDEMVQTGPNELDPNQWTGNQRVVHFGPLAQRDAFFYYYPKGWDVLYPAHFGFFPYRTTYVIAAGLLMGCVDEMVQMGPNELDPNQWTGNQRVVHFGPLAQLDAFFYYYPKGWDVLYPAHFGFFPYRTTYVIAAGLLMGCVDEMVQMGPNELDPNQWTGNQRVVHFGPLAQRDAFFYYYPKGWDVLYPAHFGFFPYRTTYVIAAGLLMGCVDEMVQTGPNELDPNQWTGNQRVIHFGPLAQRDAFFYYYLKGWDVLYPAHFGFFPYRTTKFRGSSPTVCTTAFGVFLLASGAVMVYLGFFQRHRTPFWDPAFALDHTPPIQVAGPLLLALGALLTLIGLCRWWCSLNLFTESLQHTQQHHVPPRRTVHTHRLPLHHCRLGQSPYQPLPPPPAFPIVVNAYTEASLFSPESEAKLYPPVMPSNSMMSLQRSYVGSPYNTLSSPAPGSRYAPTTAAFGNAHALAAQVLEMDSAGAKRVSLDSAGADTPPSAGAQPPSGRRGTRISLGRQSNASSVASSAAAKGGNARRADRPSVVIV